MLVSPRASCILHTYIYKYRDRKGEAKQNDDSSMNFLTNDRLLKITKFCIIVETSLRYLPGIHKANI